MSPTDLWRLVVSIVTVSVYDARSEYTFVQDGEEWSYQVTLARLASMHWWFAQRMIIANW